MTVNASLAVNLGIMGLVFLLFAVIFAVKKERACGLIAGFNSMTKEQQAQYDRSAMARDYRRMFTVWTVGAFLFAGMSLLWGWVPFCAAWALLIFSTAPHMHLWAENAFKKYKIDN